MNRLSFALLLVLGIFVSSCISERYIDIQVLNPAKIKLPTNLNKVYIISKSFIKSPSSFSSSDRFTYFFSTFYDELQFKLGESPLFTDCAVNICTGDSFPKFFKNLTFEERKLAAVINFDSLAIKDTVYESPNQERLIFEFRYDIQGKIAKLSKYESPIIVQQKDTLLWDFYNLELDINLPAAYGMAGKKIGTLLAEQMAPFWSSEERILYYYTNKYMRKAYKKYIHNDLTGAISIWKKAWELGTSSLSSAAAHNIAVCYEILDDLDGANEWIVKSVQIKERKKSLNYLQVIQKRNSFTSSLDKQLLLP